MSATDPTQLINRNSFFLICVTVTRLKGIIIITGKMRQKNSLNNISLEFIDN